MKKILILLLFSYLSGCHNNDYSIDQKKTNCSLSSIERYPYGLKPVLYSEGEDLYIILKNSQKEVGRNIGSGISKYSFNTVKNENNNLEFCANGVVDLDGSNILVPEEGYKSQKINLGRLISETGVDVKDGVYSVSFLLAGSITNKCQMTIENGTIFSVECPKVDE